MLHPTTLTDDFEATIENPNHKTHQITIVIEGTAPDGAEIALNRKAPGSNRFLPLNIGETPIVFDAANLANDTVIAFMQISEIQFVPNAAFKGATGLTYGFKTISWRE
jgi:hypothetical protein